MAGPGTTRSRRRARGDRGRIDFARATDVPRAGVEDAERRQRRARWMRRWVWLAVALAPIAALAIVVSVANLGPTGGEPDDGPAAWDAPTAAASAALLDWLQQPVPPLVAPVVLGHLGSEVVTEDVYGPDHVAGPAGTAVRVETFVVSGSGQLYEAALEVFVPTEGAPAVSSGPSLEPVNVTVHHSDAIGWVGATDVGSAVGDPIAAAVDRWALALLSGDPEQLRLATGDGDASRTYLPLPATPLDQARVLVAGTRPDGSDRMVARVAIEAQWRTVPEADQPEGFTGFAPVVYDVLVERASTATPVVVAWGGPGTGMVLEPYDNAVPVDEVEQADDPGAGLPSVTSSPTDGSPGESQTDATPGTTGESAPTTAPATPDASSPSPSDPASDEVTTPSPTAGEDPT